MRFPVESALTGEDDAQLEVLYAYYSGPLTECLAGLGVDVSPEPGLTTFVENYGTDGSWNPYDNVAALSPDEINRITPRCPQEPEGWSY